MKIYDKSGMTLVEMMISVALVVVVIGLSMTSYLALARASSIATQCSEMHSDLRLAFDRMTKDLLSASSVVDGGTTWFRITAERASGAQDVYYIFSSGKLYQSDTSLNVIAENLVDFTFTFYRSDGVTVTTTPADAYSVDIYARVEKRVGSELFDDVLQTRIMLRNK